MKPINYIDRVTQKLCTEEVYGEWAIRLIYKHLPFLSHIFCRTPFFSLLYGWWMRQPFTKKKVISFINKYKIDISEFEKKPQSFESFNDFFTRKIKNRPIPQEKHVAIIPADGRYYFYADISKTDHFIVKGQKFSLGKLIQNEMLTQQFENGSMVIARLCPVDYHRFHFPLDCTPTSHKLINGYLYSVNPWAISTNIHIFTQNKRMITKLETEKFGTVLMIEIGATNVGTIQQTFNAKNPQKKGDEKGFFSFGGSAIILLFGQKRILFDRDLTEATNKNIEIRCLYGQQMGTTFPAS